MSTADSLLFSSPERPEPDDIVPGRKITGTIAGLFMAPGDHFVSEPRDTLELTFEGIVGDNHAGHTRKSGGREPWYPRGTEMRNERQLSILAPDELAEAARRLDIAELKSEWIGGNLLLEGIPHLTQLPPRTLLFFENGVTIKIDGDNAPCRFSGKSIADRNPGRPDLELAFAKEARGLRGLVGWVEKPGTISVGERFRAEVPPQRLYRGQRALP
ncbi:MAG: molybdenum cofactor sulfurase [Pseudomonadota bacterium]